MKKTICFQPDRDQSELIHVDPTVDDGGSTDKHLELCKATADFVEQWVRTQNGGELDKHLCGGCVMTLLMNLPKEMISRGDVDLATASKLIGRLGDRYDTDSTMLHFGSMRDPDQKLHELIGNIRTRRSRRKKADA